MARGWPSIKMKQLLLIPRRNPFLDLRFQWSWAWFEVEVKCIGGLISGSPSLGECLHVLYSCKSPIWFIWICHLTPEMITHLEYCSDRTSGLHNSGPIRLPRPSDINEEVLLITALTPSLYQHAINVTSLGCVKTIKKASFLFPVAPVTKCPRHLAFEVFILFDVSSLV